jgi:hypothetical protein
MLKRESKYDFIIYGQSDLLEPFLEKKANKKTFNESCYLSFFGLKNFEMPYASISGSRKTYFTTKHIVPLVQAYDQAEMEFAKNPEHPKRKDEFLTFLEGFSKDFDQALKMFFTELREKSDTYKISYYAGNFVADEARKLISLIFDSEIALTEMVIFNLLESLAKYRRKIAFKVYEKMAKQMFKKREILPRSLHDFSASYLKIHPKLKANYQIKMLKIFGANARKMVFDQENLRIFEGLFN